MNLEGSKLSKSRGHTILVKETVPKFSPDSVRYAIAANMPENKDTDFYWEDLQAKNNNELGSILGNFVNRTFVFAEKYFEGKVPQLNKLEPIDKELTEKLKASVEKTGAFYEIFKFKDAVIESMNAVRDANKYFNDTEPWKAVKENKERCAGIINICLQLVHSFAILFNPVLPFTSDKILTMLTKGKEDFSWDKAAEFCLGAGHTLGKPEILFSRIEDNQIEK
jgi:methionyl-tRNA synthetase